MKNKFILLSVFSFLLLTVHSTIAVTWKLDAIHSNLGFSVLHLGVSDFKGSIKLNSAIIRTDTEDFSDAVITLEADMTSIDTDDDKRDEHLRSADFFDSEKFPLINFKSTTVKKESENKFAVTGNLTLHGITKPITLTAVIKTIASPLNNKPLSGIKVSGTIKRSDFQISGNTPEYILADVVSIEANMEFTKE